MSVDLTNPKHLGADSSMSNPPANSAANLKTRRFYFVLIPGFSLLALSCAIDVLRAANLDAGSRVYDWHLLSTDNESVNSSSGLALPVEDIKTVAPAQLHEKTVIAVCGGDGSHNYHDTELTNWLRQFSHRDVAMGSISDGAYVLAECGLFHNHRLTIHWKCIDAFRSRFPELDCRASILEIDRRRFSCAGGTASLDLILHFVRDDFGASSVAKITDNYFHDTVRDSNISQQVVQTYRYANRSKTLAEALRLMTNNIEQPLSIAEIAIQAGTTHRSLDRLFNKHLLMSPARYFRELRLGRSSSLLIQTSMPVSEIALLCGFNTASHLGSHFRTFYGVTPGQYRSRGVAAAPVPEKPNNT